MGDYVYPCLETYLQTYQEIIQPMSGKSEWVQTGQLAPDEPRNPYRVFRLNKTIKCGKYHRE